jgi:NADH:ubiquinone oxidoreductase subunit 4 (subunit M)
LVKFFIPELGAYQNVPTLVFFKSLMLFSKIEAVFFLILNLQTLVCLESFVMKLGVITPFVAGFVLLLPKSWPTWFVKACGYWGTLIPLYATVFFFFNFQPKVEGFQFLAKLNELNFYLISRVYLGLDGLSIFFFALTALLFPLCVLNIFNNQAACLLQKQSYVGSLLSLEVALLLAFSTTDLFVFYIAFEFVLIPMFFIIGAGGSGLVRIKGAYYFFFFTLIGSLFFSLGLGFSLKIPMFPLHS